MATGRQRNPRPVVRDLPATGAAGRVNVQSTGPWHHFLYGDTSTDDFEESMAVFRERVVTDSGAVPQLAHDHQLDWGSLDPAHQAVMLAAGATARSAPVDIAAAVMRTQAAHWERERTYARVAPRRLPADLTGLQPDEAGAIRAGLAEESDFRDVLHLQPTARFGRVLASLATTASYLSVPHFVPPDIALDVVTTAALDADSRSALRLPAPWCLVLHDAVSLTAAEADDQELAALLDTGHCAGHQPAVIGGLLAAHSDHTLDPRIAWLMITGINKAGHRFWNLQPAAYGDHAGGRALFAYAAQLSFANWTTPDPIDEARATTGKPGSAKSIKRVARTQAARNGAFHHVRVLDYTPPPEEAATPAPAAGTGTPLTAGTWRRAHWKPGVRIGIRDLDGRLVGPVYKTGIEGQTFTRERRFFRRARIRPDLDLRDQTTVYRIPAGTDRS